MVFFFITYDTMSATMKITMKKTFITMAMMNFGLYLISSWMIVVWVCFRISGLKIGAAQIVPFLNYCPSKQSDFKRSSLNRRLVPVKTWSLISISFITITEYLAFDYWMFDRLKSGTASSTSKSLQSKSSSLRGSFKLLTSERISKG